MPRKLPWRGEPASERSSAKITPAKRARNELSSLEEAEAAIIYANAALPSTKSPEFLSVAPTSPIASETHETLTAPEVEYMREGFDQDDGYMMVEDELYSIAQEFTKHLHQQEFIRQKKLARTRMPHAIAQRPVIAMNNPQQRLQEQRREKDKVVKRKLRDIALSDDHSRRPFLSGLLEKDKARVISLNGIKKGQVKTKSAMGVAEYKPVSNFSPLSIPPGAPTFDHSPALAGLQSFNRLQTGARADRVKLPRDVVSSREPAVRDAISLSDTATKASNTTESSVSAFRARRIANLERQRNGG